jgi:hypothetical protein
MNTIILTAAVKPSQSVAINDRAERLLQYCQSIRRWIVESPMDRIIVVEGSGTPIVTDELRSLAREHKKTLEEQVMDLSSVVLQYGRGRGEALMFDAVVPTLPDGTWFKCTGRLYVENVRECLEGSTPVAMQKCSDTPAHLSCDTRFFKCTREYYLRELAPLTSLIDAGDNFIEKVYPAIGQLGAMPIIAGRGAHANTLYDGPLVRGRKTIYVRRSSGSGNQLFQFAFGKALAIELDADLYFDIDTSYTLHEQFILAFPNIIKHKPPPAGTPVHSCFAKSTPEEFEEIKRRIADGPDHAIICGYFQMHHHIVRHETAIREALRIEPLPAYQNCIAVCVRRGDFVTTGLYIDLSSRWFTAAVEYVRSRINAPGKVLVFSNDPVWCRANLPWEVVSRDAWHDMRAIRSCAGVVFTNSTFHWWGAWLANVPTVCAAAINYQYPETFYDPRWVQMHNDGVVSIPVEPGGHVTSAIYGADHGRFNVTNIINKLHAQGLRHIRACNEIAGDPAPNIVKRLEIEFADGRKLRVPENVIADISEEFDGHHAGQSNTC